MLGLGRLTKTVSDATIGTAIVLAHVAFAEYLETQRRARADSHVDLAAAARRERSAVREPE
jgi:hypothetical protein